MNIVEKNIMIAKFLDNWTDTGLEPAFYVHKHKGYEGHKLRFHYSWNWLMPVIGKISNQCEEPEELDGLKYALLCDDINTAYDFVVDYLESYNKFLEKDINEILK